MVLWVWLVVAQTPALDAWHEAQAALRARDEAAAEQQAQWLKSPNPFLRQAALDELRNAPIFPKSIEASLLSLLDDTEVRPRGWCVELVERQGTNRPWGEGEFEELAHCRQLEVSNADLAAQVLQRLTSGATKAPLCDAILRTHRPVSLRALGTGCSEAVTQALPQASDPRRLLELLVLLIQPGSASPASLELIAALLDHPHPTVAVTAAGVLLTFTWYRTPAHPLRAVALEHLSAVIGDPTRTDALDVVRRLPAADYPFADALLARLANSKAMDPATALAALRQCQRWPPRSAAVLERLLRRPELVDEVLTTVANAPGVDRRWARLKKAVLATASHARLDLVAGALQSVQARLTTAEFSQLDRLFTQACEREPVSYHIDPNEDFCGSAVGPLTELALEHGFRFWHPHLD